MYTENLYKYCTKDTIDNLYGNYSKVFGVEVDLSLINENGKSVGVIIFKNATKKLELGTIIEFDPNKIKWRSVKTDGNLGFYIVNQYWCKHYSPEPKIDVPVKIYDEKNDTYIYEHQKMSFSQFMKRRLFEFYSNYSYKFISAYDNFLNLKSKQKPYYYCINATVRNYHVREADLKQIISMINHEKRRITTEWNKLLNQAVRNNQSMEMINRMYNKINENKECEVIPIRKTS